MLKKDSGLRLYIDYRGLNKVLIKNRYLLPLILEILDGSPARSSLVRSIYRIRIIGSEFVKERSGRLLSAHDTATLNIR